MSSFASSDVALFRRNRLMLAVALAPLVLGVPGIIWSTSVGTISVIIGVVATLLCVRSNPLRVAVWGSLVADEDGVSFSGRRLVSRASLRGGFLILTSSKLPLVRLQQRLPLGSVDLQMRDETEGRALLRTLGFDASHIVATFTCASRIRANPWFALAGRCTMVMAGIAFPVALAEPGLGSVLIALLGIALVIGWLVLAAMPTRVVVGGDGLLISWFFRRRFLGYGDVRAVHPFGSGSRQGLKIFPGSGVMIQLPIKPRITAQLTDQETDLVIQRIQQGIASYHQRRHDRDVVLPERGERSLAAWIRLLRSVGSGANADHRTAPIAREELYRIAEDPGSPPAARAGAAIAVSAALDEAGRARLRIAAMSTAEPDIRALLELSAEEADQPQLERALERVVGA